MSFAAGYDTTAHTLAWALWHLAGDPAWRTRRCCPRSSTRLCAATRPAGSAARDVTHDDVRRGRDPGRTARVLRALADPPRP